MKTITLNQIIKPKYSSNYIEDRFYKIYLGEGVTVSFTNIKEAEKYINKLSLHANNCLTEIIEIQKLIYSEYWALWFYLDSRSHIKNGEKYRNIEKHIQNTFDLIYKNINKLILNTSSVNGIILLFNGFYDIIYYLQEIVKLLSEVRKNKKHLAEFNKLQTYNSMLNTLYMNIKSLQNNGLSSIP